MIQKKAYYWIITVALFFMATVTMQAQDYTVNSLADTNTGAGTSGTLRWCISQANASAGPHTITFDALTSGGTIVLSSPLPIINQEKITIDGIGDGSGNIVIDANANAVFSANANGDFTTIRNFIIQDTNSIAFTFSASPTDITIENIELSHTGGNLINYGIYVLNNALRFSVTNFTMSQKANNANAIYIAGTATDVVIDGFNFSDSDLRGNSAAIRVNGAANNVTISNSVLDMESNTHATDDANYGIYFNSTTTNVTLDNVTMHDAETYGVYFAGVATDITLTNSTFDNFDGGTANQMIRFNSVINGLVMTNVDIDLNVTDNGTSLDDGNIGIYFVSHLNQDITKNAILTNVNINQADDWGLTTENIVNNLTIDGSSFTGNSETSAGANYGIEFDNAGTKSNILIQNSTFTNLGSAAIEWDMRGTNNTSNNKILNNIFSGTVASTYAGYGIWLWYNNVVTDLDIIGNTIFNNAADAISIRDTDGVNISQNNIYNNLTGIDNWNGSGNNDLEQADGDTPTLYSSIDVSGGNYDVTFNVPTFCTDCDVEFFTNQEGDNKYNGRTYTDVATGLSAAGNPYTITVNSGGATDGFWTTTLKDNNQNGSVSEFSKSVAINPKGPAGVNAGIAVWLRADMGLTANAPLEVTGWNDQSGNSNNPTVVATPDFETNALNFNPGVNLRGVSTNEYFDFGNIANGWTEGQVFVVTYQDNTDITSTQETGIWRIGGSSSSHLPYTNEVLYESFGNNSRINAIATPTGTDVPYIYSVAQPTNASGTNTQLYWNGTSFHSSNRGASFPNTAVWLGKNNGNERYQGHIPEFILYNRALSDVEREKIESYLALKYGMILPHNYYASDWNGTTGSTFWTLGGGYDNDIAGIGRDDDGILNQKQSKSINTDAIVTIGLGTIAATNAANANTFTADKNFLVWGNDDGSTSSQITDRPTAGATAAYRIGREWKVQEIGTVSNLTISFSNVPNGYNLELYIDTDGDGDFANATTITGGTIINGKPTFTGIDLNDGDVFTLGFSQTGPGGIATDLSLWLKANTGTTISTGVSAWVDQSGNSNNATQGTGSRQPVLTNNAINFNPSLNFTAASAHRMNLATAIALGMQNSDYEMIVMAQTANTTSVYFPIAGADYEEYELHYNGGGGAGVAGLRFIPDDGTHSDVGVVSDYTDGFPHILSGIVDSDIGMARVDGINSTELRTGAQSTNGGALIIGERANGSYDMQGYIPEVIIYNKAKSNGTARQQIESYLSIKYGMTLNQNYLASDASVIWDATVNAAYSNDIAGIGRDDLSALTQKQSKSVNDDAIVTMGLGTIEATNAANTNTFTTDKDFMLWGNNAASEEPTIAYTPNSFVAGGSYKVMARVWKIAETGPVGTVRLNIPASYAVSHFIVDTDGDGDFNTGTPTELSLVDDGNGNLTADYDFEDGDVFTFGNDLIGPGGVFANMNMWLKANENVYTDNFNSATNGTPVEFWKDNSSNNNSAVQGAGNIDPDTGIAGTNYYDDNRPTFVESSFNYNPAISYDGLGSHTTGDWMDFKYLGNNRVMFIVAMRNSSAANDYDHFLYGADSGNDSGAFYHAGANGTFQWNGAYLTSGWRKNGTGAFYYSTFTEDYPDIVINEWGSNVQADNIGYQGNYGTRKWDGNMQEVILYNSAITTTERNQIESYLALKYGITLDQSTAQNYIASDGVTTVWDASANATYSNDITGIARDAAAGLNQKQSKSVNDDAIVSIGLGEIATTNIANANTFTTDKDFLVWGNDDASTGLQSTEMPAGVTAAYRLGREWKVQETGSVSNLAVAFSDISSTAYDLELYVDTDGDGDFTNATIITGGTLANGVVTFSGVDLNNDDVFTLGLTLPAPGGVINSLSAWYRADFGTSTAIWEDQSVNELDAVGRSLAGGPTGESVNFNPSVPFAGSSNNEAYDIPEGLFTNGNTSIAAFSVGSGTGGTWFSGGHTSTDRGMYLRNTSATASFDFPGRGFTQAGVSVNARMMTATYNSASHTRTIGFNNSATTSNSVATLNYLFSTYKQIIGHNMSSGSNKYNGNLPELIFYNDVDLTTQEIERVESYMAIKYGLSLAHNYYASDWDGTTGTTLWTLGGGYDNDIAGIGQDELSALTQKQSKSVNDDAMVTIGLGAIETTNADNTNTFTTDKDFLVWGNDDASTGLQSTEMPAGAAAFQRLGREWKVQETGSVSNLTVAFSDISSTAFNFELYVDTDGDFTNATIITGGTLANGVVTFNGVDLNNGDVFTLGYTQPAPGGVITDLEFWVKANTGIATPTDGANVPNWKGQSPNSIEFYDSNEGGPIYSTTRAINFNPVLEWTGLGSQEMMSVAGFLPQGPITEFAVASWDILSTTADIVIDHGIAGQDNEPTFMFDDSTIRLWDESRNESVYHTQNVIANIPVVMDNTFTSGVNGMNVGMNGVEVSNAKRVDMYDNTIVSFGNDRGTADERLLDGLISEGIGYSREITAVEKQKVRSYLAVKYGVTLDQTSATNYLASDATVLWDASTNAAYSNDIAGIGRDELSALTQTQSKSVNDDAMVTIGLGSIATTNIANTNTFTADKNFLVWGNDDASTALQTDDLPTGALALQRLGREWKVQNTGAVGNVTLSFSNVAISPLSKDFELFIDPNGDGDFSDGTVHGGVAVVSGNTVTFTGVTLANGTVFTLGMTTPAPGGIAVDLSLWLRADIGTSSTTNGTDIDNWIDQSTNQYTAASKAEKTTFEDAALNFNPAVDFTSDVTKADIGFDLGGDYVFSPAEKGGMHILSIVKPIGANSIFKFIYDFGNNSGDNVSLSSSPNNQYMNEGGALSATEGISTPSMIESDIDFGALKKIVVNNKIVASANTTWTQITTAEINEAAISVTAQGPVTIGRQSKSDNLGSGGARRFFGDMGEVIVYSGNPEGTDALQIRSYLAIKYGITLDQTLATNYVASDATVLWNATANAAYSNNIAGIGQDDLSVLIQKQSKSVNDDVIVTIGLGTIAATNTGNTNTFAANKDFLIWGNDTGGTGVVNSGMPSVFGEKIARNWLVNETGAVGTTLVQIPESAVAGFTNTADLMLYVADDDGFTTNLITIPLVHNGTNWEATIDFDGAKYFTFGVEPSGDFMRHGKTFNGGEEQPMKF